MTVISVVKGISLIIFVISCVTIYHNTNSFEPKQRIIYIIIGNIVMYIVTSIICSLKSHGISVDNESALKDTTSVMKWIFTPLNSMIIWSVLGNIFGKVKDRVLETDKAGKHLIIAIVVFIIILIFEANYIGNFISGTMSTLTNA